jgi:hypothetical protein
MFCPKCGSEYREGFTHCSDCDVDLVKNLPEQLEPNEAENEKTFIPILSTYNLGDIDLIKSILDNEDIAYFLKGENTAHISSAMDTTVLMVEESQVNIVKELLKNFDLKFMMFSKNQ